MTNDKGQNAIGELVDDLDAEVAALHARIATLETQIANLERVDAMGIEGRNRLRAENAKLEAEVASGREWRIDANAAFNRLLTERDAARADQHAHASRAQIVVSRSEMRAEEAEARAESAEANLRTAHSMGLVSGIVQFDSEETSALRDKLYHAEERADAAQWQAFGMLWVCVGRGGVRMVSDETKRLVDRFRLGEYGARETLDAHLARLEQVALEAEKLLIRRMVEHHMPGLDDDQLGCITPCQGCELEAAVAAYRQGEK